MFWIPVVSRWRNICWIWCSMAQEWWLFPAEGPELSLVEPVLQGKGKKKRKLKTHTVNREITCHRPNDHISLRESERKRENRPRRTKEWSNQTKVKPSKNRKQLHIDEPTDWTNTVKMEVRRKIKPKQRKNEPIKLLDEEVCDHAWLRKRKKSR